MKLKSVCALIAAMSVGSVLAANTWYVDDDNYGGAVRDGSSENPYGTIQEAIDAEATQTGDTIKVRPGVYSNDVVSAGNGVPYPCRVFVRKNVRIISTDGKDATVIEGVRDPGDAHGMGDASVACVFFYSYAPDLTDDNVVLDGFTLRNGTVNGSNKEYGGGVAQSEYFASRTNYHVVDCVISNCASRYAVNRCVTLHRCIVTRNWVSGSYGSGLAYGFAENTLFFANVCAGDSVYNSSLINCTFAGQSGGKTLNAPVCLINSILALNDYDRCNGVFSALTNSVVSTFECSPPEQYFPNAYNSALAVASTNIYHAPIFGDFRPIANSPAVGRADARLLPSIPLPSDYVYRDLAGNEIDVTSATPIQAGAYQETVDISTECCVRLTTQNDSTDLINVSLNGFAVPHKNILFAYMPAYPGLISFGSAGTSSPLSNVKNPFVAEKDFRFVGPDGLCWLPRPKPGESVFYPVSCATRFYYVDPRGSDSWDGSCDYASRDEAKRKGPWKTLIHSATNSVVNNDRRSMIFCAAGLYDEGKSGRYRVLIPGNSGRRLHFISADGRGKAVIVGAPDPTTDDGNGPNAVSCIYGEAPKPEVGIGFSGFAITGGHSPAQSGSWAADFGAICRNGGTGGLTLSDSVITNNTGVEDFVYNIRAERCLFADNKSTYRAMFGGSRFSGCVFRDNNAPVYNGWFTDSAVLVNCHIARTTTSGITGDVLNTSSTYVYNSVFTDCTSCHKGTECRGCVFDGCAGNFENFSDYFKGDARLAYKAGGDYRPLPDSPVWAQAVADPDGLFLYGATDYEGTPVFDGSRLRGAGAFLTPATGVVSVDDADARLTVAGLTPGSHVLEKGATLTIAPNADSTRPVIGWSANGTNWLFNAAASKSFTLADVMAAGGYLKIEPVLGTEWFVNANTDPSAGIVGSDGNHGFSRHFPKRMLKDGVARAIAGDTVHAAEGVYDDGTMNKAVSAQPSRVEVPAGVSLVADGAVAKTVIRGASGSGENGFGAGAVRCVQLGKGASVTGFTLADGHMVSTGTDTGTTDCGAGVCSYSYSGRDVFVNDCLITNCVSMRSVLISGTYRNCRVVGCKAMLNTLGYQGVYYGTLFAGNVMGDGGSACFYYCSFENVTYANDNVWTSGAFASGNLCYSPGFCNNSLVFTRIDDCPATNSVFVYGVDRSKFVNCRQMSTPDVALDADYVPTLGVSKVIDLGTNDCQAVANIDTWGGHDAAGNPRVMNGVIDVGAFEADWRPRYSADIRRSRVDVVSVTPSVVETAEKTVALGTDGKGGALTLDCLRPSGREDAEMTFDVRVTGTGTLTVTPEGGEAQVFTFSEEKQVCTLAGDVSCATFAYAPGTGDAGTAEILGARLISGALLLIR